MSDEGKLVQVTDIAGIAKLMETVGKGVGWTFAPFQLLRIARAEAKAVVIRAEGEEKALDLAHRAARAREAREMREHANIEAVVRMAAEEVPEKVSSEPVDGDWAGHFFDDARLVSQEDMQRLWAKLLAGEVQSPGSFSSRTLNTLRLMTSTDARMFATYANWLWDDGPAGAFRPWQKAEHSFTLEKLAQPLEYLEEIGLVRTERDVFFGGHYLWRYHESIFAVSGMRGSKYNVDRLTRQGSELFSVLTPSSDAEYVADFAHEWTAAKYEVQRVPTS